MKKSKYQFATYNPQTRASNYNVMITATSLSEAKTLFESIYPHCRVRRISRVMWEAPVRDRGWKSDGKAETEEATYQEAWANVG